MLMVQLSEKNCGQISKIGLLKLRLSLKIIFMSVIILPLVLIKPMWIEVYKDADYVKPDVVKNFVKENTIKGGFLILPSLARDLQSIPMVREVRFKRLFGGGLRIVFKSDRAIGYLAGSGIITEANKVIKLARTPDLLIYDGAANDIALMRTWLANNLALFSKLPFSITELGYDNVSAQWRILFDNNMVLLLGHSSIASINLKRFAQLLPYFKKHKFNLDGHIFDLRYPAGFAYSNLS